MYQAAFGPQFLPRVQCGLRGGLLIASGSWVCVGWYVEWGGRHAQHSGQCTLTAIRCVNRLWRPERRKRDHDLQIWPVVGPRTDRCAHGASSARVLSSCSFRDAMQWRTVRKPLVHSSWPPAHRTRTILVASAAGAHHAASPSPVALRPHAHGLATLPLRPSPIPRALPWGWLLPFPLLRALPAPPVPWLSSLPLRRLPIYPAAHASPNRSSCLLRAVSRTWPALPSAQLRAFPLAASLSSGTVAPPALYATLPLVTVDRIH